MRGVSWVLVLAGGLALGQDAQAQTLPAEMVVVVPQVEVRSGPTKEYYATSVLRQGDRVLALRQSKDQPGWLAIKPPTGSFSWVNGKNVKLIDARTGYIDVDGGPVAVLPGSSVTNKAPNVEAVKIAPGFLVTVVDKPFSADGNTWLPIVPPPTEVRFVPAEALRPVGGGTPTPSPLLAQAEAALGAGQFERAKALYKEAMEKSADHQEKMYAYNRLMSLEKTGTSGATGPFSTAAGKGAPPVMPASGRAVTYPPQWSAWATLRKAAFEKDGQPVYYLEGRDRGILIYVLSQPGTSLREYVGRTVCLYGSISYRTDDALRTHYLVASHVATP